LKLRRPGKYTRKSNIQVVRKIIEQDCNIRHCLIEGVISKDYQRAFLYKTKIQGKFTCFLGYIAEDEKL
jgi:hypothetical protein